ncbi:MAG: dockerin type I repeat-containing protein [Phycisphaerales bacterium]|nr:dockerin type I repeat-containing protein [Phycisphaerales bacterium]
MKTFMALPVPAVLLSCHLLVSPAAVADEPGPIHVITEVHCDPMGSMDVEFQEEQYDEWVSAVQWGLDQSALHNAQISFLSTGQFMEWVLARPESGFPLIEDLYASGHVIGTHMHNRRQEGPFNWVTTKASTPAQVQAMWDDHIAIIDAVVEGALGVDAKNVRTVNNTLGSHVPSDDELRINLMEANGFIGHEQGPDEEFFVYFEHYAMNPWRPSKEGVLRHDEDGPVVLVPFGPVLGKYGIHFGILQDMRPPAVKARFLMQILNWLYDLHVSQEGKVWVNGWAAHCHDLMVGGDTHGVLEPTLAWFAQHFVDKPVGGAIAATFSSIPEARDAYLDWEAANPGEASFNYEDDDTDWNAYPYLVPPARYLVDAQLAATLPPIGVVRVHRLIGDAETDPHDVYVVYNTINSGLVVDLSVQLGDGKIAAVDTRIGTWEVVDTSAVPVPVQGVMLVPPARTREITMFGDLNDDGTINGADLALVLAGWAGSGVADMNGDGVVDGADLAVVLMNWTG